MDVCLQPGPQRMAAESTARIIFFGGSKGCGKAQPLHTLIATPTGWQTLGSLRIGDHVLGRDGRPARVLHLHPINEQPTLRVHFHDEAWSDCSPEHLWTVETFSDRRTGSERTIPASDMVGRLRHSTGKYEHTQFSVRVCDPLDLPDADLPIDPYLLGCWLGDGSTHAPVITSMDSEVHDAFAREYPISNSYGKDGNRAWSSHMPTLRPVLKTLKVFGHKHIPAAYLRGSIAQRIALFQGLMDTDGFVDSRGHTSFTTTSDALVRGAAELIRSLGVVCTVSEGRAKLYGRDCGPVWDLHFSADFPVCRLARKASRLARRTGKDPRNKRRFIERVEAREPQLMRCITVEREHYLCEPELIPTHNSNWLLHDSAKWFDIPGRVATIFRRTYTELTGDGGLWNESFNIYPLLGGTAVESKHKWEFPSGGGVQMRHLQHVKDAKAYNGKNIGDVGFDELPFFEEEQFWTMLSCQRSTAAGDPPKIRATMNPDPDSWVLQFVAWYLDDSGFPDPAKRGVVRWFGRRSGKLEWYASEEEAKAAGLETPMSFTFIGALIWDNPALLKARPEYLANLRALPPIEQARYLGGNWKVRPSRGDYFQQQWFPHIPRNEIDRVLRKLPKLTDVVRTWRSWDFGATPVEGDQVVGAPQETHAEKRDDADWTRGWKFGQLPDGRCILLDLVSARDAPGAIEHLVRQTAERDGRGCVQVMWQDPAQAGVHQVVTYNRLLKGFRYVTCLPVNPLIAAKLASEQAYQGRLLVPDGAHWLEDAMRELEGFPIAPHDDVVSALALGVSYWLELASPQQGKAVRPGERPAERETPAGERQRVRTDVRTTSRFKEHF